MKIFKYLFFAIFLLTNCEKFGQKGPIAKASDLNSDETTIYLILDVDANGTDRSVEFGACCSTKRLPTVKDKLAKVKSVALPYVDKFGVIWYKFSHYSCSFDSLTPNTTYYIRSWASNNNGTYYGEEINISTLKGIPQLTTNDVTSISAFTASCGGNITHDGGLEVTARGVCWTRYPGGIGYDPTLENSHSDDGKGIGSFNSNITGLLDNGNTYKVRAYATNSAGTAYGNTLVFSTGKGIPILSIVSSSIVNSSVVIVSNISDSGGAPVTKRGICWKISDGISFPTIADKITIDGSGDGEFVSTASGLTHSVIYWFRPYATNSFGTAYGENKTIMIMPPWPPKD
jgi:hypothetical protein